MTMEGFGYILASASPRRREILSRMLNYFEVMPSNVEELKDTNESPIDIAMKNALAKAQDIAERYPDAVVIGADTIVVLEGKVLGKPGSPEKAVEMLESLSGRAHRVITGLAVVHRSSGTKIQAHETSMITFRNLCRDKIKEYVREKRPLDKAGAYGIQEIGEEFVEQLEGDYDNVVGLPLELLRGMLEDFIGKEQLL